MGKTKKRKRTRQERDSNFMRVSDTHLLTRIKLRGKKRGFVCVRERESKRLNKFVGKVGKRERKKENEKVSLWERE